MEELLIYAVIVIVMFIKAVIEVALEERQKKDHQEVTVDNSAAYEQKLRHAMQKTDDSNLKTQADIDYRRAYKAAKQKDLDSRKRVAVACPNCGAPLKTIYDRCDFCEMSYKEANDRIQRGE